MKSLDQLLSQFKDGDKRMMEHALFNKTINMLLYGTDPIEIIDILLRISQEQSELLNKFAKHIVPEYIIGCDLGHDKDISTIIVSKKRDDGVIEIVDEKQTIISNMTEQERNIRWDLICQQVRLKYPNSKIIKEE